MEHKIQALKSELSDLSARLSDPGIYSSVEYPKLAKRQNYLETTIGLYDTLQKLLAQRKEVQELSGGNDELAELAKQELVDIEHQIAELTDKLDEALTPKDPNDERNCIIEIRAGAGGDESSLFGAELYKMYSRYAEINNFKV